MGDPYPSGRMKRRILAAIGSVCNALYHDRSGFTIWGLADFLGIFTFGFSERKPLEESGSECYNETVRLLARLWHQPEKTDRKSGKPCRQIRQQKRRDRKITELLSIYVENYKDKSKSNKWYKSILFGICILILAAFSISFIVFICKIDIHGKMDSIANVVQIISVCVTFLGLIIGLLQTITKYIFPENEEEYITRIVEMIQNNDLENKKENIRVQGKGNTSKEGIE